MSLKISAKILPASLLTLLLMVSSGMSQEVGFTQDDRDRLIRLETTLEMFMAHTSQRFEQMDKRFEDLRADTNQRFEELRADANQRSEQVDKRFEQVDKRFEELRADFNLRFEQLMTFLWILVGIFTTQVVAIIGFAWWDRRTTVRRAREETMEALERMGLSEALMRALRKFAENDPRMASALRTCGLL